MTEYSIPADAEGLPKNPAEMKAAFETGLILCSLLNVCRAAAHLLEEDDGYYVKSVPADLAKVLQHAERLATDVVVVLEKTGEA